MDNIRVRVSPVIKQDGRQKIFISFIDDEGKKEAEAIIPGCVLGFQKKKLMFLRSIWKKNSLRYWRKQDK